MLRRIVPVLLRASRKRAPGYINLVVFDDRGNIVRRLAQRARRATEAMALDWAKREKANLEARGYRVSIDPVVKEHIEK